MTAQNLPPLPSQADGPDFGVFVPRQLFGIIGHPLGHTLSPLVHNWGFAALGLKASYMAFPTPPEGLPRMIEAVRVLPVQGLSVTVPHKETVMPLLDSVTDLAARVGAVNTLVWEGGRLTGHNTDVAGFLAPLAELEELPASALLLGAGGAAKAVMAGLAQAGVSRVTVVNRSPARARDLAQAFGADYAPWEERFNLRAQLVVNSTQLGMSGKDQHLSPLTGYAWREGQIAYDLIYNPDRTLFLTEAQTGGARIIGGRAMFVGQACEQFRLWTGRELPRAGAAALVRRALGLGGED